MTSTRRHLPVPHLIPTRATVRGNNGGVQAGVPRVDPQDRIDSLLAHLGTKTRGLTGREAQRRLDQFGPNEITRTQKSSRLGELARQLAHPLALGREPAEPGTMDRSPRPREAGIISRAMLSRAWLRLGALEALLVTGGYFLVLSPPGGRQTTPPASAPRSTTPTSRPQR